MKNFFIKSALFLTLLSIMLVMSTFFLPNPALNGSMYLALLDKHALLEKKQGPGLILVGGSNLSFGLSSEVLEQGLGMPVVNMGLHAGIGLKYSLQDVEPFLVKGDVLVISPEYEQLYADDTSINLGAVDLLYILFDIYPRGRQLLDSAQWLHLSRLIPGYAAGKFTQGLKYLAFSIKDLIKKTPTKTGVYDRAAFNGYGDVSLHWTMAPESFRPREYREVEVDLTMIEFLKEYSARVRARGVRVLFVPPVFQQQSFTNIRPNIEKIAAAMGSAGLNLLAPPERYVLPDDKFFNSPYHPNGEGVILRTRLLLTDLQALQGR